MGRVALVVDDDLDTRNGVADLLVAEGFEVEVASGGTAALRLLRNGLRPCAIVLDVKMPGMDGLQFLEQSKGLRDEAKVILMTAMPNADFARSHPDVHCCLPKPFEPDELVRQVRDACP